MDYGLLILATRNIDDNFLPLTTGLTSFVTITIFGKPRVVGHDLNVFTFCHQNIEVIHKVGCIFPMVISSEFRMGQYRDDDHREDASHFSIRLSRGHGIPGVGWL